MVRVDRNDVGVEDSTLEILDLFAGVCFAEVAEVVEAEEFVGGGSHGGDVEVAFSPLSWRWCGGGGCEGGLGEEVTVLAFFAGEAGGEVGWWVGTPG